MKMADIDIDPVSDHDKMKAQPDNPMGKTIPLNPRRGMGGGVEGGSIWEPK